RVLYAEGLVLADETALVEDDAAELIHGGLVGEDTAVEEIGPAARDAERDAMGLVRGGINELGAEIRRRGAGEVRRQHAARAELGQTRVGDAEAVVRGAAAIPDRQYTQGLGQILDDHVGAQLVEVEPLHQGRRQRAWAIEEEAAAVGGVRFRQQKIDDDLALRREQRGKDGLRRRHLVEVAGDQAVEELARVVAGDLDHAAVGEKR